MNPAGRRSRLFAVAAVLGLPLTLVLAAGLSGGSAYRYLGVFQEVWTVTRTNYVEPVDETDLLDGAYRGMLSSLDGASAYLAPGEEKVLQSPPGAGRPGMETLPSGGGLVIVRVDAGGPAARAGLEVGDQVWKIGGKPVRQMAWPQAKRRLSGPVGGKLDLQILEGRSFKLREARVDLEVPKSVGYALERRGPTLYLRLDDPDVVDPKGLAAELGPQLDADRSTPLLVDLRGTVGLDAAAIGRVAGVFFPGSALLRLVQRSGMEETVSAADGRELALRRPLYALVDGTTAGAGEAVAALLRERAKATVIGRSTYGLGVVPELIPLSSGGSILLGTREIRTTGGVRWSEKGLEPDKVLTPAPATRAGADDDKRDLLLDEALRHVQSALPAAAKAAPPARPS